MSGEDLQEVLKIERASYSKPWPLAHFHSELKNPLSNAFTAIADLPERRIVAGYVIWRHVCEEIHFLNLAVRPLYRQRGIGTLLLKYALHTGCGGGAKNAYLEVRESNVAAQKLYKRSGFHIIGTRKKYYSDNREDAVIMQYNAENGQLGGGSR